MESQRRSPMQRLMFLALVLLGLGLTAHGAPAHLEVKAFPGFDGRLLSKQYAGYITVGDQIDHRRHLYYYFATSERNPSEDAVLLWLNGGPGCSGLYALIHQHGPFKLIDVSVPRRGPPKIKANPFSWTKFGNIIYVDSPAGSGYSYADSEEDYNTNDTRAIPDLYEFILKWFSEYPEFLQNPLYIGGCSYSGVIVPVLAQEIVNGNEAGTNPNLNFKGYSLGNGLIDVNIDKNAIVHFAYRMGLLSDEFYEDLSSTCEGNYWNNTNPDCLKRLEVFYENIKGINHEHVHCLPCQFKLGLFSEGDAYLDDEGIDHTILQNNEYDASCHGYETKQKSLFDLETTRKSLHAVPIEVSGEWFRCAYKRRIEYERDIFHQMPYHLNLTSKGYRAFIYSGDRDMHVPYTATIGWIKMLNYTLIKSWHPWFVDGHTVGYNIQYDHNLLFATFKGAGHSVSEYVPRAAMIAYRRWIDGAESL